MSTTPPREYEVTFLSDGTVRVWSLSVRNPPAGHRWGWDEVWREISASGPTGLRAIEAASRQIDTEVALEMEEH